MPNDGSFTDRSVELKSNVELLFVFFADEITTDVKISVDATTVQLIRLVTFRPRSDNVELFSFVWNSSPIGEFELERLDVLPPRSCFSRRDGKTSVVEISSRAQRSIVETTNLG